MRTCEQSSQRSTWPPRAAVRQLSMADMTFSCPRLSCPARALRQAGPWRRKISASSIAGRDKRCRDQPGGLTSVSSRSSGLVTSPIALMATRV